MQARKTVARTAADPTIRFSKLEIEGAMYSLAYDYNAIAVAENVAGVNLLEGLRNLENLNAQQLRGLLYAALLIAHPRMTIEEAGSLIRLNTLLPISEAIAQAYVYSLPEKKKDPSVPEPAMGPELVMAEK